MAEASSSKPPRPIGSQSRPLSTIDEDPLRDQVECPDGRRLYNDGHPLWTREHLLFIQRQIAANPESITTYPNIGTPIDWVQPHYGDPTVDWQTVVVFEGWRFFTHPKTQLAGKNSLSSLVISGENTMIKEFDSSLRQDMEKNLAKYFDSTQEIWARSRARYSIEELLSGYELPPTINKVVCFGLGNNGVCRREFEGCSQHAAALTIRAYLENRLGHEVRLLTQDPGYNRTCRNILGHAGFNIVGMNGLDRFLEVDDNSLVFSVYPGVCVKEILAELARPAIIIDLPIIPEDLNWAENFYAEYEKYAIEDETFDLEFQLSIFRDKANPDTPRTIEMFKEYHDAGLWSPSKEERNREEVPFWTTDMEVWIRKRGSKPRKDESSDVLSEVDSEEYSSDWSSDESSDESSDGSSKSLVKELVKRILGIIWGDVDDD
ncbi:hypothetical protein F5Y01DRAFT_315386 [Xylaria sp. FL0043]|nr:hypothetical protein F5Y01DRAFT_315386 [Xylaria sp. FL0043]